MTNRHEDRPTVTVPVDGFFAVPDPADESVTTFWQVDGGEMRAWPSGTRWAPSPPRFDALTREERVEMRGEWYRLTYWPWKAEVARRIAADPAAARRRFAATYPRVELARPPAATRRAEAARREARREFEAVWAAVSVRRGASVNAVARRQGCAWATARAMIAQGELVLATDPDRGRRVLVDGLRAVCAPDVAERLVDGLLGGPSVDPAAPAAQNPTMTATDLDPTMTDRLTQRGLTGPVGSTFGAGALVAAEQFERGSGDG